MVMTEKGNGATMMENCNVDGGIGRKLGDNDNTGNTGNDGNAGNAGNTGNIGNVGNVGNSDIDAGKTNLFQSCPVAGKVLLNVHHLVIKMMISLMW